MQGRCVVYMSMTWQAIIGLLCICCSTRLICALVVDKTLHKVTFLVKMTKGAFIMLSLAMECMMFL